MNSRFNITLSVFITFAISSCGTSKKLQTAELQINELNAKNAELTRTIDQLHTEVAKLSNQNKETTASFSQYRDQCEKMEAKYKNANEILREQDKVLKQLDEKLESALGDLEDRGITVHYKRGLLFVSMEDQLLYKSGSSKLDKKGIDALSKIAGVMNDYPDVKIIVVGNTDNVIPKNGTDNWTLSTERANSIVRTMRDV